MPDVSRQQQKAMFAAKAGKSTLGIPKSVGEDFIAADKAAGFPHLPQVARHTHVHLHKTRTRK